MKYFALFLAILLAPVSVEGRIVSRDEVANALRARGFDNAKIETFLCIVDHESHFESTAYNPTTGDHGIYQISQIYWCSPQGNGCGMACNSMRDDDINNDTDCAVKVYYDTERFSGNGFTAWTTYQFCH